MSYQLGGLFGKDEEPQITGSVIPVSPREMAELATPEAPAPMTLYAPVERGEETTALGLSPNDWLYARGALGLALTGREDDPPVSWINPDTGRRGAFVARGTLETRDGMTCRAFRITRQDGPQTESRDGMACRTPSGQWDVAGADTAAG